MAKQGELSVRMPAKHADFWVVCAVAVIGLAGSLVFLLAAPAQADFAASLATLVG